MPLWAIGTPVEALLGLDDLRVHLPPPDALHPLPICDVEAVPSWRHLRSLQIEIFSFSIVVLVMLVIILILELVILHLVVGFIQQLIQDLHRIMCSFGVILIIMQMSLVKVVQIMCLQ